MMEELCFIKRLSMLLLHQVDKMVAEVVTQDLGQPGLSPRELRDFALHIQKWRMERAARLGNNLWQSAINIFIFWTQSFFQHNQRKPGETMLQVNIFHIQSKRKCRFFVIYSPILFCIQ